MPRIDMCLTRASFLRTAGFAALQAVAFPSLRARAACLYPQALSLGRATRYLPQGAYFTYPHSNGFLNTQTAVLARPAPGGLEYLAADLTTGATRSLAQLHNPRAYYAIARTGLMAVPRIDGVSLVDLHTGVSRNLITLPGWHCLGDLDISPDGTAVLINRYTTASPPNSRIDRIDVATGRIDPIHASADPLDHAHFSPYDPSWICFSDGAPHSLQRSWVWHATHAPTSRQIFQQLRPGGTRIDEGHERAFFNKLAILAIAYPDSSAEPRGLYEVGFDGATRAVSPSNSDSHCNISQDGRWAVVSSLSPVDGTPGMLDLCARTPGNWTQSDGAYVESDITVVNMATGRRQFLFRASNAVAGGKSIQPFEAHPAISPDGRWVVVKNAKTRSVAVIEIDQDALHRFLA